MGEGQGRASLPALHPKQKRRGLLRGVLFVVPIDYFETDFLNMRSIFSFVASQQA